jgi:sugar O-acyltransferase (sialic acid O-acetyltransferase NeuD family)
MSNLLIYGSGKHAAVVAEAAVECGWSIFGYGDDQIERRGTELLLGKVICTGVEEAITVCRKFNVGIVIGAGNNRYRYDIVQLPCFENVELATIVHPSAIISRFSTIGKGTVVMAGAVVNCNTKIGNNCIINTGSTIDHDNILGNFVHVSPGAHLGGTVEIGDGTHVGIGASVRNNISIGAWSVVGAGAAVVKNVPDNVTVMGVPARTKT